MISDVLDDLNRTAKEIRIAGHLGWGNACEQAADDLALMVAKIEVLCAEVESLNAARERANAVATQLEAEVERLKDMRERELEYVRHTARNTDLAAWARNRATVDRPGQGETK